MTHNLEWFKEASREGKTLYRNYQGRTTEVLNTTEQHAQYHLDLQNKNGAQYFINAEQAEPRITRGANVCVACEG